MNVLSVAVLVTCLHIWTDIHWGPNLHQNLGVFLSRQLTEAVVFVRFWNGLQWKILTLNSLLSIWSEYIINLNNNLSVSLLARNLWCQISHTRNDLRWEKMMSWFIFFIIAAKKVHVVNAILISWSHFHRSKI